MLDLLQESLVFLKEQYEMLMCLEVIIDQRRERCRVLLSKICKQIIEEIQRTQGLENVLMDSNKTVLPSIGNAEEAATQNDSIKTISKENFNRNVSSIDTNYVANKQTCSTVDNNIATEETIHTIDVLSETEKKNSINMESITNHEEIAQTSIDDATKTNDITNVEIIAQTHGIVAVDTTDSPVNWVVDLTSLPDNLDEGKMTKTPPKKVKPKAKRTFRKIAPKRKYVNINLNTESNQIVVPKSMRPSGPKFKCDYCGDPFEWKSLLYKHVLTLHTGEPYHCNVCNKSFHKKSSFVLHKQRHVNNLKCPFCGQGFERVAELTSHECKQTGGESFTCNLCAVSFPRKDLLDCHFVLHSNAVG